MIVGDVASNVSTGVLPRGAPSAFFLGRSSGNLLSCVAEKFLNTNPGGTVCMSEGKRVAAGEAILSGLATIERGLVESRNDSLAALVREHSRLVYRVAYAVLRSHHDAEDATQETFLRVLRYGAKLADVKEPKTWLTRIAWRVAVDRSQRWGRTRETALDPAAEAASLDTAADQTVHGAELGAAVERLIAALPAKLREPLILSAIEEMSPREIAGTLGISDAAVRSRVFRARQILREKLAGRIGGK